MLDGIHKNGKALNIHIFRGNKERYKLGGVSKDESVDWRHCIFSWDCAISFNAFCICSSNRSPRFTVSSKRWAASWFSCSNLRKLAALINKKLGKYCKRDFVPEVQVLILRLEVNQLEHQHLSQFVRWERQIIEQNLYKINE